MKNLEFIRFRKDKDDPQYYPVFKSKGKVILEVRTAHRQPKRKLSPSGS